MRLSNRLFISIFCITALLFINTDMQANVYASQITITNPDDSPFDGNFGDGTGAKISFFLNDTASSVTVEIVEAQSGTAVHTINAGAFSRGKQSVDWDGTGATANQNYLIRITAEQDNYSTTEWTVFYDTGDINIFSRGLAAVTNQSDPNFGLFFTANDGGPLGTGINIYNPDGSFHDPFLVAADQSSGGTVNYGTDAPLFTAIDWQGRLWVTAKDLGQVIRINRDFSTQVVIDGLTHPTGLYLTGEGADFTLYVSAENQVLRGNIGTADVFDPSNMEVVANFTGFFPRQIMLDDDGAMYVTLRESVDLGSNGKGIRKYDISGTLPVTDDDALWFLSEDKTFIANDLLLDHGSDPNTSADDILYYCTRAGSGFNQDGIWRIDDINSFFPDTVRIVTESDLYGSDENINARATIDFDAAGNIILAENSNEHIFFIAPPGSGATNAFTSTSAESFLVTGGIVGIDDDASTIPTQTVLLDNYPNPFNPKTIIPFKIANYEHVTLTVYDLLGKRVATLVNRQLSPGYYEIDFDASSLPSGYYLYHLQAGKYTQSKKMLLTK